MTKPHISTVLQDEDDNASIIDDMFAKLDLCTTSAVEAPRLLMLKKHRYELHLVLMNTCQQLKLKIQLTSLKLAKQNRVCFLNFVRTCQI
jgi:hypothetical protein